MVFGTFGTVPKSLVRSTENLEIVERAETIQIAALLR